jgi:hypothetical protein
MGPERVHRLEFSKSKRSALSEPLIAVVAESRYQAPRQPAGLCSALEQAGYEPVYFWSQPPSSVRASPSRSAQRLPNSALTVCSLMGNWSSRTSAFGCTRFRCPVTNLPRSR